MRWSGFSRETGPVGSVHGYEGRDREKIDFKELTYAARGLACLKSAWRQQRLEAQGRIAVWVSFQ